MRLQLYIYQSSNLRADLVDMSIWMEQHLCESILPLVKLVIRNLSIVNG